MKTGQTSRLVKLSGGISIALLAFGFSFGSVQGARAEDAEAATPTLHEMFVAPLMQAMDGLDQRLSRLEESVALFAATVSSQRVAARQLCVSDDSGAETCITKAQLDDLLKRVAQADLPQSSVAAMQVAPAAEAAESAAASEAAVSPADTAATETSEPADQTGTPEVTLSAADNAATDNSEPAEKSVPDVTISTTIESTDAAATETVETIPATVVIISALAGNATAGAQPELAFTGSATEATPDIDGTAIVLHPEVEITIAAPGLSDDD